MPACGCLCRSRPSISCCSAVSQRCRSYAWFKMCNERTVTSMDSGASQRRIDSIVSRARTNKGIEYKWIVLINTTIGVLMSSLDGSILTISLPDITRSLGASVAEMMWVLMGYSLIVTALLLPISRLADMKGRVNLYNLGFAIFTIASALCGLSQSGMQLVLFRLVQGVGAALLFANGTALLTDAFPPYQRGLALGINSMAATAGFILGTILGGVITEFLGWRYIFFINLPFGAFATAWAFWKLHEIVEPERKAHFDIAGMATFPLGIASILAGLTFVVMGLAGEPITDGIFVVGGGMLVVFVLSELHVAQPMMELALFRVRLFWAGNTSLFLNALGRGSTMFIMSWFFQAVLNDSPLISALKLLPLPVTMVVFAPIAGRLSDRLGSRWLSTIGLTCTLVAQLLMISFPLSAPYVIWGIALAILGVGNGLFNSPNMSAVMGSVPPNRRGVAAGMTTLLFNSGQTMAIATTMVILSTVMSYKLLAELFTGTATGGESINGVAFMQGLHEVFLVGAVITVVAIVCSSLRGTEDRVGKPSVSAEEVDEGRASLYEVQ